MMKRNKPKYRKCSIFLLSFLLLATLGMTGCQEKEEPTAAEGAAEPLTIVTSFYPMYVLTLNITEGAGGIEVVNMAQAQTGCLHDYQLTTADMKTLDGADVLVINGAGMETFLDKVTEQIPNLTVITASENMELLEEHHHHHGHSHADDHSLCYNPHVWVSPTGAADEAMNIAVGLAAVDPENAAIYQENARLFEENMTQLKEEMQDQLDGLTHRQLVTFHEAFPYFAQEFGLEIAAVVESEPGQEPVASEIDAIMQTIREQQIPALFVESEYADQTARLIADETGIPIYTLNLVVTGDADASAEESRSAYEKAMRENLAVLMEALQ